MINLQDTPSAGPLTAADVANARQHSAGTVRLMPAGCGQNRWPERRISPPQAASASSELLEDDAAADARFRAASRFWTAYLAVLLVALCAVAAHFLPVLKTLAN